MDADHLMSRVAPVLRRHIGPGQRLTVALSGGLDSVVLLHLLKQLLPALDVRLAAHHVNHGISPHAAAWADFCARLCHDWHIPFAVTVVDISRNSGVGLEGAARAARYEALGRLDTDFILLAHHQDDQAETLLLQLFRGTGVQGLGGMAEIRGQVSGPGNQQSSACASPALLRPLLGVSRRNIEAYARANGLHWTEDESNADRKFARNFLRHEIFPLLEKRFPAAVANVAQAAARCAEAGEMLDDLAAVDGQSGLRDNRLDVASLERLSPARAKNLLRFFLRAHGLPMPEQGRLDEMLRQLCTAGPDRQLCQPYAGVELRRFRKQIYVVRPLPGQAYEAHFRWHGETKIMFPDLGGGLYFDIQMGTGAQARQLRANALTLRHRRGGERLKPGHDRPTRSLKNLLQETAIPPWERECLPLLYIDDRLAWVARVGLDVQFQTPREEAGVVLRWEPDT